MPFTGGAIGSVQRRALGVDTERAAAEIAPNVAHDPRTPARPIDGLGARLAGLSGAALARGSRLVAVILTT
jgi:hypothetical protein